MAKKTTGGKKGGTNAKSSSSGSPYILIILVLVTVILVMINHRQDSGKPRGSRSMSLEDLLRGPERPEDSRKSQEQDTVATDKRVDESKERTEPEEEDIRKGADDIAQKDSPEKDPPVKEEVNETTHPSETVTVFFLRFDEHSESFSLVPVRKRVTSPVTVKKTIEVLLKGTDAADGTRGLISSLPSQVRLRNVRVVGRTAELDFSTGLEYGATGSVLLSRLDQIVYTATEFPGIDSVVILINGERRKSFGSDGISLQGPLHRRNGHADL